MAYSNSWSNNTAAHPIVVTVAPSANDVLVAWVTNDSAAAQTFTWPAGFTEVANLLISSGDGASLGVAIKNQATGSETTLSISNAATGNMIGGVTAFSGRNNTTPQDVTASAAIASGIDVTPATFSQDLAITPVTNGDDICAICMSDNSLNDFNTTITFTDTGALSWTTHQDIWDSGARNIAAGHALQSTAAAMTVTASGISTGGTQNSVWTAVVLLALKSASTNVLMGQCCT
jgi:hypothetical protein